MRNSVTFLALVAGLAAVLAARTGTAGGPDVDPASSGRRLDQTIGFERVPYKEYLDPDFELFATASSDLPVSFTASGDCSVRGTIVHILSAGKCWLTAHQPGSSKFNAAEDVDQRLSIAKAGQRIDFQPPPAKVFLEPDFVPDALTSSQLSVSFEAFGECSIIERRVHIAGAGSCSLSAHQTGDSNFTAARIVDQSFTIARADQEIDFAPIPDQFVGAYGFPLSARAGSGLPVTFEADGPCTVTGSIVSALGPGACTVAARQSGNANFNPAPEVARTFVIPGSD